MAKADWIKIKNEYISTDITYKDLAKKYHVSKTAIADKGKKENWVFLRQKYQDETCTKLEQETQRIIVAAEVDRISKMLELVDTAQEKVSEALGQLDAYIDMSGNVQRSEVIDVTRLRKLVAALKDIKDIVRIEDKDGLDKLDAVLGKIEGNI